MTGSLESFAGLKIPVFSYDQALIEGIAPGITGLGYGLDVLQGYKITRSFLEKERPPLVVCDDELIRGDWGGLRNILDAAPKTAFIVITRSPDLLAAIEAIDAGALAYLPSPVNERELAALIELAFREASTAPQRRALTSIDSFRFSGVVGRSKAMRDALTRLQRVASTDLPILILGENGTGKELAARAVHENSLLHNGPFVPVHVGAITESLVEGELFGWVRGAHSTAAKDRKGYIESADGGSLFLDEIGDIPATVQVKLLRVLETKSLIRLGETRPDPRRLTFRLIAATNRDLEAMTRDDSFRLDLYHRIAGFTVRLPPLRERQEDMQLFVDRFVADWNRRHPDRSVLEIPAETIEVFKRRPWPGNMRELKHTVEVNAALSEDGILRPGEVPLSIAPSGSSSDDIDDLLAQNLTMREIEKLIIERALELNDGNRKKTATQLGIPERTFYRKLNRLDLQEE